MENTQPEGENGAISVMLDECKARPAEPQLRICPPTYLDGPALKENKTSQSTNPA